MRTQPWTEKLTCELSAHEIAERRAEVTKLVRQLRLHQAQMKDEGARLKTEEKRLETAIDSLSTAAETGHEERDVELYEEPDPMDLLFVRIVRCDTLEVERRREMTPEERQRAFRFTYSPDVVGAQAAHRKKREKREGTVLPFQSAADKQREWDERRRAVDQARIETDPAPPPSPSEEEAHARAGDGSIARPNPVPAKLGTDEDEVALGAERGRDGGGPDEKGDEADDDADETGTARRPRPLDPQAN